MALRTVVRCPRGCEPVMGHGLRFGPTPKPVPVRVCWECGYETDGLACCPHPVARENDPRWSRCGPCGDWVYATIKRRLIGKGQFCSTHCRAAEIGRRGGLASVAARRIAS